MADVVQTVQNRTPKGLVFHIEYKVTEGGEKIVHNIPCDLTAPTTLVIQETKIDHYYVSIIADDGERTGEPDRREWFVREIIHLKFGYAL